MVEPLLWLSFVLTSLFCFSLGFLRVVEFGVGKEILSVSGRRGKRPK